MAVATDLTFDFHLNKSGNPVRRPFPQAIRVEDPARAPPGWLRAEWEDLTGIMLPSLGFFGPVF